jgi:hypothetical protein
MRNKTTARWANTRVSERLGVKDAKEQVMEMRLDVALNDRFSSKITWLGFVVC